MPYTCVMPKLSPTMVQGTIAHWHKKVGDFCEEGSVLIDVCTDKATIEYTVTDAGYLRAIIIAEGASAKVGDIIAVFSDSVDENITSFLPTASAQQTVEITEKHHSTSPQIQVAEEPRIAASPLAKKLAKQQGISLSTISGTGPKGRIMKRDLPDSSIQGRPLTPVQRVIADRLTMSKTTIPHFYCSVKVQSQALLSMHEEIKALGKKYTINDYIVAALARALMEHPTVRSSFLSEQNMVHTHEHADIAVAVSVPGGLFTPIVWAAETKSLETISQEIKTLVAKTKSQTLIPQEYTGGACTISNLGMFGIESFFPIINPPQVAILGVGAILHGSMTLCVSGDHRVLDGVEVARFLNTLQKILEAPIQLLM